MGEEDEYCAIKGITESELGLKTNPEIHICTTFKDTVWNPMDKKIYILFI